MESGQELKRECHKSHEEINGIIECWVLVFDVLQTYYITKELSIKLAKIHILNM